MVSTPARKSAEFSPGRAEIWPKKVEEGGEKKPSPEWYGAVQARSDLSALLLGINPERSIIFTSCRSPLPKEAKVSLIFFNREETLAETSFWRDISPIGKHPRTSAKTRKQEPDEEPRLLRRHVGDMIRAPSEISPVLYVR